MTYPTRDEIIKLWDLAMLETATGLDAMEYFSRAIIDRCAPAQDAERERQQGGGDANYTRHLEIALMDCAKVAILRGDVYLCDCIDNTGKRYQSQFLADLLARAQRAAALEKPE